MEFLSTWYGMALAGIVLVIVLFSMTKIVGFVARLIFLALIVLAAFLYFRHLIY